MTEEAFQAARKVMQTANGLRSQITSQKGEVVTWTKLEDFHKRAGQDNQAIGCKKKLDKVMLRLTELRQRFSELQFPDINLKNERAESAQCEGCGNRIAKGNTYCGECLCED